MEFTVKEKATGEKLQAPKDIADGCLIKETTEVPFPKCSKNCTVIEHLGAGECESCCPKKFGKETEMTTQDIPEFKTTNEAVAFGKMATPEQKIELAKIVKSNIETAAEIKRLHPDKIDERIILAQQGRLCWEALNWSSVSRQVSDVTFSNIDEAWMKRPEPK